MRIQMVFDHFVPSGFVLNKVSTNCLCERSYYYINISEVLSAFSHQNMISPHMKVICYHHIID